jgi:hypothetical protein
VLSEITKTTVGVACPQGSQKLPQTSDVPRVLLKIWFLTIEFCAIAPDLFLINFRLPYIYSHIYVYMYIPMGVHIYICIYDADPPMDSGPFNVNLELNQQMQKQLSNNKFVCEQKHNKHMFFIVQYYLNYRFVCFLDLRHHFDVSTCRFQNLRCCFSSFRICSRTCFGLVFSCF